MKWITLYSKQVYSPEDLYTVTWSTMESEAAVVTMALTADETSSLAAVTEEG